LEVGVLVDKADNNGKTAIMCVAENKNVTCDLLKLMVDAGAKV
jgi:hypothetical protein